MTKTTTTAARTIKVCPICRITRNCDPTGCIKCYLAGRVTDTYLT